MVTRAAVRHAWLGATALALALAAPAAARPLLPPPHAWVYDYARVISPQDRAELSHASRELEQKTTAQLVVVTVRTTDGQAIDAYARRLFQAWNIGPHPLDNGALLLFAIDDRRMCLQVGRDLRSVLSDDLRMQILEETVRPFFREGQYSDGAHAGAASVAEVLSQYYNKPLELAPVPRPPAFAFLRNLPRALRDWSSPFDMLLFPLSCLLRFLLGLTRGLSFDKSGALLGLLR